MILMKQEPIKINNSRSIRYRILSLNADNASQGWYDN